MLDSVLAIGRVLRSSPDGLKHHRFIKKAPVPDEKRNPVQFWQVPVEADGSFDFSIRQPLLDENKQKHLFYLNYKQSDADSTKPYLFGDVYRTVTKTGEDGNFRFGDPNKGSWMHLNSFERAEKIEAMATDRVMKFRDSFRQQLFEIEEFLRDHPNVYVHFDFDGRGWHHLKEVDRLNESLLSTFFESTDHGYVLKAFLFKTLGVGTSAVPGFAIGSEYKSRIFKDANEAMDLLYGIDYSSRSVVRKFDFKLIVLPRGTGLTSRQIERFFEQNAGQEPNVESEIQEEIIRDEVKDASEMQETDTEEEMTAFLKGEAIIPQFDLIFSKAGGTKPDIDMIELAGLERSKLTYISQRIRDKQEKVSKMRQDFLEDLFGTVPAKLSPFRVTQSFLNLLGDTTRSKKKYQSHLFHVLPQIYTETYFQDPVLLPALIEKTEFNLRNDAKPDFNFLKFDFYFLTEIQNVGGKHLMEIKNSTSYQLGVLLGHLARPLRFKINSFDKNYAGLLSRRIGTQDDVIRLSNELNQKLIMHQRGGTAGKFTPQLTEALTRVSGQYNKDHCAFGFFESYFAPKTAADDKEDEDTENASENNADHS